MAEKRTILVCSCEDTMPLDAAAIERGCRGANVETGRYLCRAEVERFRKLAQGGGDIVVGCTQEAPLFAELAGEGAAISFANIRETAGWSKDAAKAGPKMAALIAAASEPLPLVPFVTLNSEGVALVYGRDEQAIEAANLLKDHLDVTVLITKPEGLYTAARHRVPGGEGHDQIGEGPSRRVRAGGGRLRCSGPIIARRAELRRGPRRRRVEVRHRARSFRRDGAVSGG